jgi:hypothetical protein
MPVELDREATNSEDPKGSPPPQGHVVGVPYDLRRPSGTKFKARLWNPGDLHFFTPKVFGAGWDINFYWFCHPLRYMKARRAKG